MSRDDVSNAPVLVMEGITKSFGGIRALKGVNFDLKAGEVQALVGQNGAGKSTLIKILAGALVQDAGTIQMEGANVTFSSPADALRLGIGTVYQDPLVYPELSVSENIFMGRELRDRYGSVDMERQVRRVEELLRDLDVDPRYATYPIGQLSVALRQLALIAKSLSWEPKVMVFDEPTAILTQHEAETLFRIIRRLRERGVGIIYISHRLEEIYALADRVTVLKDGESRGTWPVQVKSPVGAQAGGVLTQERPLTTDQLIELMAGHALIERVQVEKTQTPEPILQVRGLTQAGKYRDISFEVHGGEILGFFGLVGAGRSEMARAIFGEDLAEAGEVMLDSKAVHINSPRQAVDMGIAYLPEDRKGQGTFGTLSVGYNEVVAVMRRLAAGHLVVRPQREEVLARQYVKDLDIKTPNTAIDLVNLSGGNQQKVVLAKWLATHPRILILDEPTAGIDVAAKQEIHSQIIELARSGVAIILISSELQEVLKLSDRIISMHEGSITGEFPRDTPANIVLGAAMEKTRAGQGTQEIQAGRVEQAGAETLAGQDGERAGQAVAVPAVERRSARWNIRTLLRQREAIVLAILIVGSLLFNIVHPTFLTLGNISSILSNVAVVGIVSIGMTAVIVTGGIDVSVGSILALCMLIAARVLVAGVDNVLVVLLVAVGVGLLMGLLNGALVAFGRIHPIIVTLGMLNIVRALHIQILGPQWITPPPVVRPLALSTLLGLPVPWWIVLLLGALAAIFMARWPLGRHIYGLGGNADAARLAGINTRAVTIFVYAFIGLLVGVAALIQLGLSGTVQPNAGTGLELQVIAATVIGGTNIQGGRGTVVGSILGALLVQAVHNALITLGNLALLEGLVIGALIVIAVGIDVLQNRKAARA